MKVIAGINCRAMRLAACCLLAVVAGAGCATVRRVDVTIVDALPGGSVRPGMTRDQVRAVMARPVVVGYDVDPVSAEAVPVTINGPYSTEIITAGDGTYLVDRYLAAAEGEATAGHPVKDEALVPMVFRDNVLVGQGQETLNGIRAALPREK